MVLLKLSQLSVFALALASPAVACVQYSCNLNYANSLFNAALTDNGGQKCQATNVYVGIITADNHLVKLSCVGGYSATFDFNTGVVSYSYPSFSGSFGTTTSSYENNEGIYFSANVWGC